MDECHSLLRRNSEILIQQYDASIHVVRSLQDTFLDEVLPDLQDERDLDPETVGWAREWLQDTTCLFHILRRHNFTRSVAMESTRRILLWRLNHLHSEFRHSALSKFHVLPNPDPFGRPIILIKVADLVDLSETARDMFIPTMEILRRHLQQLNDDRLFFGESQPLLQYVVILDVAGLSIRSISVDLIHWTLHEVIPRFPGMLAAMFMVNYAWTHSGIWNVIKRLLPTRALSRVIFASREDLLLYFTPSALPEEYGGDLPSTKLTDEPPPPPPAIDPMPAPSETNEHTCDLPTVLSSMSLLNPYFGYPASTIPADHSYHHSRRRRRDLLRTLARLWWTRWKKHVNVLVWALGFTVSLWLWWRRRAWIRVHARRLL